MFEDDFEGDSIDQDAWSVGWGWGTQTSTSPTEISEANVLVDNSLLKLSGTHDGSDYYSGAINSKNKITFGPGTYVEAKIKMPDRVGFLPAFWSKPNSEAWPPEIDFVELFQTGSESDEFLSSHNVHFSSSAEVGDENTHTTSSGEFNLGTDLTNGFHTYGCEWLENSVTNYVDNTEASRHTDPTAMENLRNGAPFYMMMNVNIGLIGTPDTTETWGEQMEVDWVRVWKKI